MPVKSKAQEKFGFAHPEKFGGKENFLEEWVRPAPKNLPERVSKKKKKK